MNRRARVPEPLSVVLLALMVLVAGCAAQARAASIDIAAVGSHESRARAEFRAPISSGAISKRASDTDRPFMCRDKGDAPVDDWD